MPVAAIHSAGPPLMSLNVGKGHKWEDRFPYPSVIPSAKQAHTNL